MNNELELGMDMQEYYMYDDELLATNIVQRSIAEELGVDPVKFDRVICNSSLAVLELFEDGDEPLNVCEIEAISDCIKNMLNYVSTKTKEAVVVK